MPDPGSFERCEEVREFRRRMIEYIKTEFGEMLGDDVRWLEIPGGVEYLVGKYCRRR